MQKLLKKSKKNLRQSNHGRGRSCYKPGLRLIREGWFKDISIDEDDLRFDEDDDDVGTGEDRREDGESCAKDKADVEELRRMALMMVLMILMMMMMVILMIMMMMTWQMLRS